MPGPRQQPGSKGYYKERADRLQQELNAAHAQLQGKDSVSELNVTNTTRIGYLAEQYVRYRVARAGLSFFIPEAQAAACDLLVQGPSGAFHRCEIKATARDNSLVNIYTTRYDQATRTNVPYKYGEGDRIDFFILVDLKSEVVCVLPFAEALGRTQVSVAPHCETWQYKDRFDLLV